MPFSRNQRWARARILAMLGLPSIAVLQASAACSDDDHPPAPSFDASLAGYGGSSGRDAGKDAADASDARDSGGSAGKDGGDGSGGTSGTAGEAGVGAPVVTITKPTASATPSSGVLVGATTQVVCKAVKSSAPGANDVNKSSVKIELLNSGGDVVDDSPGAPTGNADEYSASFPLTPVPAGRISFRCTAEDVADPPEVGSATVATFLDHGPKITPQKPIADTSYALKNAIEFDFTVEPAPLDATDPAAAISEVTFSTGGRAITPTPVTNEPNHYHFFVDYNDRTKFPQTPTGVMSVAITAKNSRSPDKGTNTVSYGFNLDGSGPLIKVNKPVQSAVVGGDVVLEFTVTDTGAGVDPKTVTVDVGSTSYPFDLTNGLWTESAGNYTFRFDSRSILTSIAQVTVDVRATDAVGNAAQGGNLTLYIDNLPPIVDLDPGLIREMTLENGKLVCSDPFDPLGKAKSDLDAVLPSAKYRALVWERTNGALGQEVLHPAGLDFTSVYLYVLADANKKLVVDTNHDGVCDEISESVRTQANHPFRILSAVQPQGTAEYHSISGAPWISACTLKTNSAETPHLCTSQFSDMTRVINWATDGNSPVVFAGGDLKGFECTGDTWEISSFVPQEGWVCLAGRAIDNLGNVGISAPIRVCMSNGTGDEPSCAISSETPPSCTDNCSLPPRFVSQVVRKF